MTDREKLIELIDEAINDEETSYSNIADYLLEKRSHLSALQGGGCGVCHKRKKNKRSQNR